MNNRSMQLLQVTHQHTNVGSNGDRADGMENRLDDTSEPNQHNQQPTAYNATLDLLHRELQGQMEGGGSRGAGAAVAAAAAAAAGSKTAEAAAAAQATSAACVESRSAQCHAIMLQANTACDQRRDRRIRFQKPPQPKHTHKVLSSARPPLLTHQEAFMVTCKGVSGLDLSSNGQHWADVGKAAALHNREPAEESQTHNHATHHCIDSEKMLSALG
jgi:hypothetical protein